MKNDKIEHSKDFQRVINGLYHSLGKEGEIIKNGINNYDSSNDYLYNYKKKHNIR